MMTWEIAAPLIVILFAGLPHGAADAVLALRLRAIGQVSLVVFMAAYLLLTAVAVFFWWWLPMVSLMLFLIMSVSHFGLADTAANSTLPRRQLRALVHGGTLIVIVPLAHNSQVTALFTLLAASDASQLTDGLRWLMPFWLLGVIWIALGGAAGRKAAIEIVAIAAVLAILPPLWGFAFYFCAIHAARHTKAVLQALALFGTVNWLLVALFTAVSIAAIVIAAIFLQTTSFDSALLRASFIGLAALTVPHMLLIDFYGAVQRIARSQHNQPVS